MFFIFALEVQDSRSYRTESPSACRGCQVPEEHCTPQCFFYEQNLAGDEVWVDGGIRSTYEVRDGDLVLFRYTCLVYRDSHKGGRERAEWRFVPVARPLFHSSSGGGAQPCHSREEFWWVDGGGGLVYLKTSAYADGRDVRQFVPVFATEEQGRISLPGFGY